jgi:hypothetical protein
MDGLIDRVSFVTLRGERNTSLPHICWDGDVCEKNNSVSAKEF